MDLGRFERVSIYVALMVMRKKGSARSLVADEIITVYTLKVNTKPAAQSQTTWIQGLPFFYGWIILGVGALGIFLSGPGQTYVVSIFVDPIIQDLGWSRTLISGLYTGGSLTAALIVPWVGRLLDRYGSRIVMPTVAALFGVATFFLSSVSTPIHLFVGIVAIRSLGQGSLVLISTTLVAMWFVRQRGRAIALSALASPASQATFPLLVHHLILEVGWRQTWLYLGGIICIGLIPLSILLVRRSPESIGLLPDGDSVNRRPADRLDRAHHLNPERDWSLREAMRTRSFWLLLLAAAPMSMLGTALTFHHMSLFASKGFDAGLAAGVLSFVAPMALIATFVTGWLADKIPNRFLLCSGLMLFTVSMLLAATMTVPWHAFVYGGIMGAAQGTMMTINTIIWPNYFGRSHLGSIRGIASTAMVAFAALGPLPFGLVFDLTGNYRLAILMFLIVPVVMGIASLFATPPHRESHTVVPRVKAT